MEIIQTIIRPAKNIYIIAGCNGAGKTTASYTILPEIINCKEFVNADEIAKGLSPFQPETFAFETTLSTKSYKNKILKAKQQGYMVTLLFFWLNNIDLAKERVKTRVFEGGHNIPEKIIERRYLRGIHNLFDIYLPLMHAALVFDNSFGKHELIAHKMTEDDLIIYDQDKFQQLKRIHDNKR
nr:zeta toxin [Subsaximicrobium wynnwilliamsii]